jgi:putative flippase GtrA
VTRVALVLRRLARSGAAGLVSTLVDLALLMGLTEVAGVSPRAASVPALVVSGLVMFFGQKYFAFQGTGAPRTRELVEFAAVQAGGLALTGFLYDAVLRFVPSLTAHYVLVRLAVSNLIWLAYSFPLWQFVFRERSAEPAPARDAQRDTQNKKSP